MYIWNEEKHWRDGKEEARGRRRGVERHESCHQESQSVFFPQRSVHDSDIGKLLGTNHA